MAELTPKQQLVEVIKTSNSILILPHSNPDGDAIGASLGLKLALEKLGKTVSVVISGDKPEMFSFLPSFDTLENESSIQKDLLIVIDETQSKVGNVSLKRVSETKIILVVTPKSGLINPADVRIEEGAFKADLVIALDCANQNRLGSLFENNPSLFYEVPVANIDHHPDNTNFGKINWIDLTASSASEMLVSLIEAVGRDLPGIIDQDIATCLLTGLTTDTGCFQNSLTTPKSLTVAAQLIATGGKQQEIVTRVFRTKTLSTLRLWGRALAYIKEDAERNFAWSVLGKADFVAAQASNEEAGGVIDELLKTALGMDFVLLLSERNGNLHGSFRSIDPTCDVSRLAALFEGGGHPQAAAFIIKNETISNMEQGIINQIRDFLDLKKQGTIEPVETLA